jgi:formamidopyrimidine-DNA glycosylase
MNSSNINVTYDLIIMKSLFSRCFKKNDDVADNLVSNKMKKIDSIEEEYKGKILWEQSNKKYSSTGIECPLCSQLIVCAYTVKCGHSFCEQCLFDWTICNKVKM